MIGICRVQIMYTMEWWRGHGWKSTINGEARAKQRGCEVEFNNLIEF